MTHVEKAQYLRDLKEPHYNCTQAVVLSFEDEFNLPHEMIYHLCDNFIQGMRSGRLCGAVVGGIMVLGLYQINDTNTINHYFRILNNRHNNDLNCASLLKEYYSKGYKDKKPHCDAMIKECIELVEEIVKEKRS